MSEEKHLENRGAVTKMDYFRGNEISDGGEGFIYEVRNHPDLVMKIYKGVDAQGQVILTDELRRKLEYMKSNPPGDLVTKKKLAWPIDLVYEKGEIIGFVMPKLVFEAHIQEIYAYKHPEYDKSSYGNFPSSKSRIKVAINLAAMINEIHNKGYVVGDLNHENIGIDKQTGAISIVDCDSFHISDQDNRVFRTNVIMPGYLAPEIIAHCNEERNMGNPYSIDKVALPTFTRESDLFCLAIHIFKLLMNGVDPFRGVLSNVSGSVASPFQGNDAIERNAYVFKEGNKPSAVFCLEQGQIPKRLIALFDRAFLEGNDNPSMRPSAEEWHLALSDYLNAVMPCENNKDKHFYLDTLESCPFCEADKRHSEVQESISHYPKEGDEDQINDGKKTGKKNPDENKKSIWNLVFVAIIMLVLIAVQIYINNTSVISQSEIYFTSSYDSHQYEIDSVSEIYFTPSVTGMYLIETIDNMASDPLLILKDSDARVLLTNDDAPNDRNAVIFTVLNGGTRYLVHAGFSSGSSGRYYLKVSNFVWINDAKMIPFTPVVSGNYTFRTHAISGVDPKLQIYKSIDDDKPFAENDDYDTMTRNASLTAYMLKDNTYFVSAQYFSNNSLGYYLTVERD